MTGKVFQEYQASYFMYQDEEKKSDHRRLFNQWSQIPVEHENAVFPPAQLTPIFPIASLY